MDVWWRHQWHSIVWGLIASDVNACWKWCHSGRGAITNCWQYTIPDLIIRYSGHGPEAWHVWRNAAQWLTVLVSYYVCSEQSGHLRDSDIDLLKVYNYWFKNQVVQVTDREMGRGIVAGKYTCYQIDGVRFVLYIIFRAKWAFARFRHWPAQSKSKHTRGYK